MKIGFDFHGVLNDETLPYLKLCLQNRFDYHTFILTGARRETFLKETRPFNSLHDLPFFSISDYIIENYPNQIDLSDPDHPRVANKELWDRQKGDFARREGLDLMYEDSPNYLPYFTTPVVLVQNEKNAGLIKQLAIQRG